MHSKSIGKFICSVIIITGIYENQFFFKGNLFFLKVGWLNIKKISKTEKLSHTQQLS